MSYLARAEGLVNMIKRYSGFPNLQHYWSLTIMLLNVISRTIVVGGGSLTPPQRCSQCILQFQPTGLIWYMKHYLICIYSYIHCILTEENYISSVLTLDAILTTCQKQWTIGMDGERVERLWYEHDLMKMNMNMNIAINVGNNARAVLTASITEWGGSSQIISWQLLTEKRERECLSLQVSWALDDFQFEGLLMMIILKTAYSYFGYNNGVVSLV